jgi:hypothetical protein
MSRSVRTLGIALVLAVVGAAGAYGVGAMQTEDPRTISMVLPVPAQDPSYPVVEYDVEPDPTVAPLATGLPLHRVRMVEGQTRLSAEVPRGWDVNPTEPGANWNVVVGDNPQNTYIVRVTDYRMSSVTVTRQYRMSALRQSQTERNLEHLVFTDEDEDSFTATYLFDGYRRIAMEKFQVVGATVVSVSVVGREVDREGMLDLQERVMASVVRL